MEEEPTATSTPEKSGEIPMESPRNWLKILGFTLLGLALASGIFAAGYFTALTTQPAKVTLFPTPTPQPISQATPTPTPTPDETADWKIYTNAKYGYSIKYPDRWILSAPEACIPTCPEAADVMSSMRPPETKYPEGYFSITSWTGMTTEPQDAESMRARARLWSWKASSEEQTTVVGLTAWVISGEMDFTDEKTYFRRYVIVERDGNVYEIDRLGHQGAEVYPGLQPHALDF